MISPNASDNPRRFSAKCGWLNESAERPASASKALQAYIKQFDAKTTLKATPNGCYARSTVSSLLSSKPKAAASLGTILPEEDMVDNLVEWVNASYTKDLQRQVVPYGSGSTPSSPKLRLSELEEDNDIEDRRSIWSDPGLSTLPSPTSSVVSIPDSNVESVSTDKLVQSFYKRRNGKQQKASVKHYPSWVDDLTEEGGYPSWVDDIDNTQLTHSSNISHKNARNRLSRSLSPSFFRRDPALNGIRKDHGSKNRAASNDVWELESTDTEMLISQPIYGDEPVNMGGVLHTTLYRDKKIQQLCEQSFRKIGTPSQRSSIKGHSFAKTRKQDKKPTSPPEQLTYSQSANHYSPPPQRNSDSLSRKQHYGSPSRRSYETPQKPTKAMKNLKLSLEQRKSSVDSNNTDKLMRLSPTGIRMEKRVDGQSPKSTLKSTRVPQSPQNVSPKYSRRSGGNSERKRASEKLTQLIESSERDIARQGSPTLARQHLKHDIRTKVSPIPKTSNAKLYSHAHRQKTKTTNKLYSSEDDYRGDYPTGNSPRSLSHPMHSSPRSVPRLRSATAPGVLTDRLRHLSVTDRRKWPSSSEPRHKGGSRNRTPNLREYEETESVDTEKLVIHPPMPFFNASPSLTTESESTVGSSVSEDTLVLEQEALKTSFRFEEAGESTDMTSPSTRYRVRTPQDWERGDHYNIEPQASPKPGIITSFLEDCLTSTQESDLEEERFVHSGSSQRTSSNVSDRPVETLKKILFTVQSLTQPSEDNTSLSARDEDFDRGSDSCTGKESEELFSDVNFHEIPQGNTSLSRAYYHLSRLKKLVSVSQKVASSK